jgi:hypothetical protein
LGYSLLGFGLAPLFGLMKIGAAMLSILFHRLEIRIKFKLRGYPKNYVIIANKPVVSDAR